jgi:hypothetical protein
VKTLDELLAVLPGLRRLRTLKADLLRVLLDRRDKECTWCGGVVPKGRRQWCGDACVKAFQLRCDANRARNHVVERDGGTCRRCGRDTLAAEATARAQRLTAWPSRLRDETPEEFAIRRAVAVKRLRDEFGYARGQYREVDHDPPVIEYGGLCPVEQLRLLCGACHAAVTEALAGERARRRKGTA